MYSKRLKSPKDYLKWTGLSALSGVLSGIAAAVFLILLDLATNARNAHPFIIWFLPLAGLFIGWVYLEFGKDIAGGNNLILEEIHDPKKTVPLIMAPFILAGTVITHLFGGSAGREGTAVQMGASLSDQLTHYFEIDPEERKILLVSGAGAGFGAAIGAPWAGVIFGMEVIQIGRLRPFAWLECLIASFCAYYTAVLLRAPHSVYPRPAVDGLELEILAWIGLSGIIFGLTARFFSSFTHLIERFHRRFISYSPLKPFVAGVLLIVLYACEGSYRYAGLGIPYIQEALKEPATFRDPIFKIIFTAITVGSGFKGGEFIPLVFIGTTLGSALSHVLPVSFDLIAAVGFATVFAAASNTPLACSVMALEIFGWETGVYALIGCYAAYYVSGHHGIYSSQKVMTYKHHRIQQILGWFGELPKRFFIGNGGK